MTVKVANRSQSIAGRMDWRAMITLAAFVLALATAAARCTFLEVLRDPFTAATEASPRGAGATTSLALDLLCCIPALLVLLRRVVDETYHLRFSLSHLLMVPLAAWMAASFGWADDQFATLIATANFVAALALIWSMSQLVRSWLRLRLVVAVAYGLLLVFLVQGFFWKLVEFPDLKQDFMKNGPQILQRQGYEPGSFIAEQFEVRVLSGQPMGFNSSPNSFAAMIVLLLTVGTGAALQRVADKDSREWAIGLALVLPLAGAVLFFTGSKAGWASVPLAALMLLAFAKGRRKFNQSPRRAFWIAVAGILTAMAGVIGHGVYHQSLPTDSLNFRWRYWVASWRMFLHHPIRGVAWDNFGLHYLRDRLPAASEEVKDPHNFIVRFFVELGLVGGLLMIAWLMRLWWEMTRPVMPAAMASLSRDSARAIRWIFAIALLMIGINIAASLDFSQNGNYIIIELMKRGLYLCAFTLGALVVALRSVDSSNVDDRPAPWMLYALLVGLAIFLIHNLIEFSLFEPGPLCFFGVLAGAALGVRQVNYIARRQQRHIGAIAALATACVLWSLAAAFIVVPVARAEASAHAGDAAQRDGRPLDAAMDYEQAFAIVPFDADYAFRTARAFDLQMEFLKLRHVPSIPQDVWRQVLTWYGNALWRNPSLIPAYLMRARVELQMMDRRHVMADYKSALTLNPNDVPIRIEFARALERLHIPRGAMLELERALWDNDQLDPHEPKRLSPKQVEQIQAEILDLSRQAEAVTQPATEPATRPATSPAGHAS